MSFLTFLALQQGFHQKQYSIRIKVELKAEQEQKFSGIDHSQKHEKSIKTRPNKREQQQHYQPNPECKNDPAASDKARRQNTKM